jgi:hypothetical protein
MASLPSASNGLRFDVCRIERQARDASTSKPRRTVEIASPDCGNAPTSLSWLPGSASMAITRLPGATARRQQRVDTDVGLTSTNVSGPG